MKIFVWVKKAWLSWRLYFIKITKLFENKALDEHIYRKNIFYNKKCFEMFVN